MMVTDSTVGRLRREKLLALLSQYSRRELCERTGLASAQIGQLAAGQQTIEDLIARQIERSLSLPVGWMDQSQAATPAPAPSPVEQHIGEALVLEERILLVKFRQLDPAAQAHVRAIIDAFLVARQAKQS